MQSARALGWLSLVQLGVLMCTAQVACSSEPAAAVSHKRPPTAPGGSTGVDDGGGGDPTGGTTATTAGTGSATTSTAGGTAAGTSSAGGTAPEAGGTGGSGVQPTAGTGGGATAGAGGAGGSGVQPTAGTGGGATAGTGGVAATGGTTGTGGSAVGGSGGSATHFCDGKTLAPLPFQVTTAFYASVWTGDATQISAPADLPVDACQARAQGAVGACTAWRYTPNAATASWAGVFWSRVADAQYTHPEVCLAAGATKVTFFARGVAGGEKITVAAADAPEVVMTLTNQWKAYEISLAGVRYNSDAEGVAYGFFWKVDPAVSGAVVTEFFIDGIQIQ